MKMRTGFCMDGQKIGTGLCEGFDIRVCGGDHQMNIHERRHMGPDGRHDIRSDRQVGHEVAVHGIDMYPVGALRLNRTYLRPEIGKVSREN